MKLNIDETNDHLGELIDEIISRREFDCPQPDRISDSDWRQELQEKAVADRSVFEFACELSCLLCRASFYDTDHDDEIRNAVRAVLQMRRSQLAPNGILV